MFLAGRLGELSIAEMQCWLKQARQPVSGKKADLVDRLQGLLAARAGD